MKEARQRYETRLVEVDSGRKQEYEYKLTEGLAEMRAQNEEQIRLYKDNMDSTYQTKVGRFLCSHYPLCLGAMESTLCCDVNIVICFIFIAIFDSQSYITFMSFSKMNLTSY